MQKKSQPVEMLAAKLMEAFVPMFKGSQSEIMAATADLDLTLSQCRIIFELDRAGED